ncbi:polysaccharide biosynthesis/export family protein [Porphyrobacter sp. GA68]|uniref:polysaccharide biosynthesis/export family protein n=1 Tax=Porphyrobacter sp. GA68 TaxID=2883480 RepID=UPI001D190A64|nr:polysaccharide biosynthesis/export family protein [Porphyrobacter sp. GA68]
MHMPAKQYLYAALAALTAFFGAPAATMAQEQAPVAEAAPQESAYRINAGDSLEIYVWGEERLQRTVNVLPDGTIAFPLVGQFRVQGLLPQQVEERIRAGLRDQYRGEVPQITVSVAPTGLQFSVMGRVQSPGSFQPGRYVNVLEALSLAGGPNEFADLDNVVIIRKAGDAVRTLRVRMAPLFRSGVSTSDVQRANLIRIESGDTVIVP